MISTGRILKNYLKGGTVTPDWDSFLNDKQVNWVLAVFSGSAGQCWS
jgi:hypothetical protein